ncbi:MAG: hypothetical protein M5U28_30570 [Sandaracinaceae bacterium]|nr:hypothetical protein [Sandaracinaceae bacterium]
MDALARGLAPDGPGAGVRYHRYEGTLGHPRAHIPYQAAFAELSDFLALLESGDPGAIELGFELLLRLEPEACVPLAEAMLEAPWTLLGRAIGRALGACASERSFALLIERPDVPYLRDGLATNGYPGGVERAWACYRGYGDVGRADLPPDERAQALPALAYLLRLDREAAYPEVVRLTGVRNRETMVFATHQLLALDTPESRAALVQRLEETPLGAPLSFAASMAVRLLLVRDPARVIQQLGGEELLLSPEGGPRLDALLRWLAWDTSPSGGRTSLGLLEKDNRFAELCARLRTDRRREIASMAGQLFAALPPAVKERLSPPKTRKKRRAARAPSAALRAEMKVHREEIARLVKHLTKIGYRFADPARAWKKPTAAGKRAIAQLEEAFGPLPPALAALWTVVGSVDLRGQDPSWSRPACLALPGVREGEGGVWHTDPLVVAAPEEIVELALDEAIEGTPFGLPLAPDAVGKAGYSGGTLAVFVPTEEDDPPIEGGARAETLREHLRRALEWAGMPGFEQIADRPEEWLRRARSRARSV